MKNILLTGGLGYIGTYFYDLYKEQINIKTLDTNFFNNNTSNNQNVIFKDIRNISKEDLNSIDVIIHMSELSNDPLGDLNKEITQKINHEGTVQLLNLANKTSVSKFIYMSSASVYGFSEEIMFETSKTNPLTEYSKSKIKNEEYVMENNFTFESIILRNSTAFGFSNNLRLDLVVNDLTYSGFFDKEIKLLSDGTPKRPIVHIHDICTLIYKIVNDSRNLDKQIFNVGNESMNFSIRKIAETVGEVLDLDTITFGEHDSDQRSYQLNFDKLYEYFPDYEIMYNLERGIEDLVQNFKNYKITNSERRIKVLHRLLDSEELNDELYWKSAI